MLANGADYILYAILDFIVDNYGPVIEAVYAEVDEIEDKVFSSALSEAAIERLYMLRRDLLRLRNAAVPLIEVCRRLEHAEARRVDPAMQPLFRDVTDHVHRVQEEIDSLREVLAFAFEASLMTGQAQQAHITRRLAAWAAILAVPTAVAGIYGMNFEFMPELRMRRRLFRRARLCRDDLRRLFLAFPQARLALSICRLARNSAQSAAIVTEMLLKY